MPNNLEQIAEKTGLALKERGLKLVTAESCTGGGVSFWITSIPGSSAWFERGFVTYSDLSKTEMLGVKPVTLNKFGAVSEQAAREMAEGALRHSRADVSISITGIAGPSGGSVDKPVGSIWIAWAKREAKTVAKCYHFSGNRQKIRLQVIEEALDKVLDIL